MSKFYPKFKMPPKLRPKKFTIPPKLKPYKFTMPNLSSKAIVKKLFSEVPKIIEKKVGKGSYSLSWNPGKLKNALIANLVGNAEIVGEFVEGEARKNLLAISDPQWGKAYRSEVVSRLLTNEVEATPDGVTVKVGVRVSGGGRFHGYYIEMGSSKFAAHPWLRPAIFQNRARILALLSGK